MAKELKFVLLLDCYGELLTDKQREAMELYYCEDLSLAEIGEPLKITRQAVRSYIKRAEELLQNYENKLKFAEKLSKMQECFRNIELSAEKITDKEIKSEIIDDVRKALELL